MTSKYRLLGAAATRRAPEVRATLFDYFVDIPRSLDIRCNLKGRAPRFMFRAKAQELYKEYFKLKVEDGEKPEVMKIE